MLSPNGKPSKTPPVPQKAAVDARKKPSKTLTKHLLPQLDQISSKKDGPSPSEVLRDLKVLQAEVHRIHENHRKLASALSGPMHIRKDATLEQGYKTSSAQIEFEDNKVTLHGKTIPNIWLRDNCQCSSCMHETTKQRLQDTFAIPKDLSINSASFMKDVSANKTKISIEWSDGHKSTYTQPLLANAIANFESRASIRQGLVTPELWGSDISRQRATIPYKEAVREYMDPVLQNIRKFGFCYIDKTPHDTPKATEDLLRRIAFIRETHYGGFYDFTADLASADTAYTNIALEAHTDNTYFSDPAGLQAFHLLSHTDGSGGASLLVDGFAVADELLRTDRQAYKILAQTNVHAHASGNEGISIQPYRGFPVLEHDPATGDLLRVRWNSSDRASIELPIEDVEIWYDAARKFDALLKKKENEYWEQLVPGRVLVFDNWRVLHGRRMIG
ncbi:hypothetical protein E8E11_009496 [Didymella keratinophila]|nr:hypothetical protein E8E11_009496 [Didymella keratinophila]